MWRYCVGFSHWAHWNFGALPCHIPLAAACFCAGEAIKAKCQRYNETKSAQPPRKENDSDEDEDEGKKELDFASFFTAKQSRGAPRTQGTRPAPSRPARNARPDAFQRLDQAMAGFDSDMEDNEEEQGVKDRRSRREAADDEAAEKAAKLFDEKRKQFIDAELWETKLKRRQVSQMQKQLEQTADKLEGNPVTGVAELMGQMRSFSETALVKFDALQAVRKGGKECVAALDSPSLLALGTVSESVCSRVMQFLATNCLKTLDKDQPLCLSLGIVLVHRVDQWVNG